MNSMFYCGAFMIFSDTQKLFLCRIITTIMIIIIIVTIVCVFMKQKCFFNEHFLKLKLHTTSKVILFKNQYLINKQET